MKDLSTIDHQLTLVKLDFKLSKKNRYPSWILDSLEHKIGVLKAERKLVKDCEQKLAELHA